MFRNRPYDAIVRDLIADRGLPTDHPATNFITVTYDETSKTYDPERLASRVARAFLGVRLDCAQCHDHPFETWKQRDFQGLAAYFGQVQPTFTGSTDGVGEFCPPSRKAGPAPSIAPRPPFLPELDPQTGSRRERLASWVTDPHNRHIAQATANRAWALLFGRPLVDPIDDIPSAGDTAEILAILADDFARSGFDFRALLHAITATTAFALDSATNEDADPVGPLEAGWASFPITRLRPEQVAGSLLQAASTSTIDAQSHILRRLALFGGINDFVTRHGDPGAAEFDLEAACTIPQRLLLMNGDLVFKNIQADLFNASGQIAALAPDDRTAVEAAYLATLTRRPIPAEAAHFEARLAGTTGNERRECVTDLLWTLINTTEFSSNH